LPNKGFIGFCISIKKFNNKKLRQLHPHLGLLVPFERRGFRVRFEEKSGSKLARNMRAKGGEKQQNLVF